MAYAPTFEVPASLPAESAPSSARDENGVFPLTPAEVREFQALMQSECGVTLDASAAYLRACELIALVGVLAERAPRAATALRVRTSGSLASSRD